MARWGYDWIRLYRRASPQWEILPLSVRGLGTELLRHVEPTTGTLALGKEWFPALCRLVGAHPQERRRVKADFAALVTDGFCSVGEDGVITIRNFVEAQTALTEGAARVRAHRNRQLRDSFTTASRQLHDSFTTASRLESELTPRKHTNESVTVTGNRIEGNRIDTSFTCVKEGGVEGDSLPTTATRTSKPEAPTVEQKEPFLAPKEPGSSEGTLKAPTALPGAATRQELKLEPEGTLKAPKVKQKKEKPVAVDPEPPEGTPAREVWLAIVGDAVLAPIVRGPGDLAQRVCSVGAYPGVDVLAEVRRAGEFAARFPGKYRDGRAYLTNWLKRAAEQRALQPQAAGYRPAAPPAAFQPATEAGKAVPGSLAMQKFFPGLNNKPKET